MQHPACFGISVQSGMLTWLSNGFISALPHPSGSPNLHGATNTEAKVLPSLSGVIGWVSGGIGKVVPQPEMKYTEEKEKLKSDEEDTEVCNIEEPPGAEPLPNVPVVGMVSEDEVSEERHSSQFRPGVMHWIKTGFQNALPHHMPRPPDQPENGSQRSSRCSNKVFSPPPESVTSLTDVDTKATMMGWIAHGLGLALPQPVIRSKEDYGEVTETVTQHAVHTRLTSTDLVLEEVDSGDDQDEDHEKKSEQLVFTNQAEPDERSDQGAMSPSAPTSFPVQEDAGTQTGRWTPLIESIKKEAEDKAMAAMEERLRQERLDMARMAEEVARHAAEVTVRELSGTRVTVHTPILEVEEDAEPE
ncbi:cyclic nucleotide-gated cation channel beta-1-like [Clarias magur]|uniref:Cyclic nucleotide-gated cation channel beta-1-like n=1 Tax=Clarias magur TaxID=1594786 RepID=A0A8J4THK3_CLAMG|nr:cyclic nucleotide-gated cation channel beta-1-like [Clarias magur]